VERISGVHQTLELIFWSITLHVETFSLRFSSVINSLEIGIHFSLKSSKLKLSSLDTTGIGIFSGSLQFSIISGGLGLLICCWFFSGCGGSGSWSWLNLFCLGSCLSSWGFSGSSIFCWSWLFCCSGCVCICLLCFSSLNSSISGWGIIIIILDFDLSVELKKLNSKTSSRKMLFGSSAEQRSNLFIS